MLLIRLKQASLVALVAAIVMLTNLGGARLWDDDEPRNAGCAREMLERGDWIVPTFNAELRTHKPVLLYWCQMTAYLLLGVSEFSARLPSALAAIASCVCTYLIGRRLFGPGAGIWAGVALASSLMFVVAGRAATPDSVLILSIMLAMTIYVFGTFRPRFETTPLDSPPQLQDPGHYFPQHWPTVVAMYAAMGLAVLAKGPIGLVFPTAVIGMFLLIMRLPARGDELQDASYGSDRSGHVPPGGSRAVAALFAILRPFEPLHFLKTCWYMRPLTAIFASAAVALPWYAAVGLATEGEFLRGFLLEHNLGRAGRPMEGHSGPIFYYPVVLLIGFFPWSVFAIPLALDVATRVRRRENFHPGYLFAVCWIGVFVGLFSIARTKLPSYITPCYPALALLAGSYVDRWSRLAPAVAGRWLVAAFSCLALVGAAVAVGIPLAARHYMPGDEWLGLVGLTPLAGGIACLGLAAVRNYRAAAGLFGGTAVAFVTMLFAVGAAEADRHQTSHLLLEAIYAQSSDPKIASYRVLEPSWVYYAHRPILELPDRWIREARTGRPRDGKPSQSAALFLAQEPEGFLITTRRRLTEELVDQIPPDVVVLAETKRFMKGDDLVVLGRPGQIRDRTSVSRLPGKDLH